MTFRKTDKQDVTPSGITILNAREDKPAHRRVYQARISDEVTIECEAYTLSFGGRSWRGELSQRNGDTVWFEPERPAKKILDRDLVPAIVARCEEMFAIDRAYMGSNLRQFKDETGAVWEKVSDGGFFNR